MGIEKQNTTIENSGGAVAATAFPQATEAALSTLSQGGNAVDAAVAAALALSVCEPSGSGLGGQTSLLLHLANGETIYLDGHSHAPAGVSLKTVSADSQRSGFRACTIPSTIATLHKALLRYGSVPMADLLQPAIRLAKDGFATTPLQRKQVQWCLGNRKWIGRRPRILRQTCWLESPRLEQPRLARTLERLARFGAKDFYSGNLAHDIAEDMRENHGLLSESDLSTLRLPVARKPVSISYRGFEIISTPPPAGGLQLLLALKLLERLYVPAIEPKLSDWYQAVALAVFSAFDEREKFPIHPDDFTPSVQDWTLGDARADELASRLTLQKYLVAAMEAEEEPGETTHLCVADRKGNVVSLTQSIQSLFGGLVANWKLGFLYNNYLTTCPRYRHPYQIRSRCLPRSNAAPTFVFKNGELVLALGAAGSRRIVSSVLQTISRVIDLRMPLSEAVAAPRVHALLNGKIWLERPAAGDTTCNRLARLFPKVSLRPKHSFTMGCVQALAVDHGAAPGKTAAADPRRDGTAGGL
ncbi:MAG: gamma-glutamyltransferase [bacterium]